MTTEFTDLSGPPKSRSRRAGRPHGTAQRGVSRERELAASEQLLVEVGAAVVSMAAVAHALGTRKARLYFHFPVDKEEMLVAVITRRTSEDGAVVSSAIASAPSLREQLLVIAVEFAGRPGWLRGNVKA